MSTEIIQGSPEWFAIRLGKVTASRVADVTAKTKSGYSTSRANYAAQLVAEILTGTPQETYSNAAMQWGTEKEPDARAAYEWRMDVEVAQVGFVIHPTIEQSGCSPDGILLDGMVEIKCPNTATHIDTLLGQNVAGKYITQIQWQMACTNRKWCDFVSFDPRMPEAMRLFVKRVERDDAMIAELEKEIRTFLAEVNTTVSRLKTIYLKEAA